MKFRTLSLFVAALMLGGSAMADDLLGGGKGNGGGGGGGSTVGGGGGGNNSGGGQTGGVKPSRTPTQPSGGQRVESGTRGNSPTQVQSTRTGRSGRNTQDTRNNQLGNTRTPIVVDSIPSRGQNQGFGNGQGSIRDQARNEDRVRNGGYRDGYYQYNNGWNDCDFWYPYYSHNYNNSSCISPWYYYTNLPGYIHTSRIQYTDDYIRYDDWDDFRFDDGYRGDRRDRNYPLYEAINDLEAAFLDRDLNRLGDLVPRRAWILIKDQGHRNYRIRSEDFYDMMADLVSSTRTREFWVTRVETGRGLTRMSVQHVYQDAWRQNRTVFMKFTLRENRNRMYEIAEYETSNRRF